MPTVRKVSSKITIAKKEVAPDAVVSPVEVESTEEKGSRTDAHSAVRTKKVCHFCTTKTSPAYWDLATLRRYMNDRGRISLRARTGACSKHQRKVAKEIKHARHLAMLPFTVQV